MAIGLEALFNVCRAQLAPQGLILSRTQFMSVPGIPLIGPAAVIELAQHGLDVRGFQMVIQIAPSPRELRPNGRN